MKKSVFKRTISIMLVAMMAASFAACAKTGEEGDSSTTEKTTVVTESVPETTTAIAETETEGASESSVALKDSYAPYKALNASGEEVDLIQVYGTGIRDYGGNLIFSEENNFNLAVGISTGKTVGTYEFTSENEITLNYAHGDVNVIEIISEEDGVVTELMVPTREYSVYFK